MNRSHFRKALLATAGLLSLGQVAHSQSVFDANATTYYDELILGFRKTGSHQANYEVVVDIGPGTNYTSLTPGSSLTVPNFSYAQLLNAFPDLTYLNWSVSGATDSGISGYPNHTLWLTVPRTNATVQTTAPQRLSKSAQQVTGIDITSVFGGASTLSAQSSSNALSNTPYLVREPINNSSDLTTFISDSVSASDSTFQGSWTQNVENITASPFSSPQVSDFYEVRPTGVTDPHTGQTSGSAYYLGYFTLATNGTMTFTRATAAVTPPPATYLYITRAGTTATISFSTTNGATYTCYYTNAAGLSHPVSTWPSLPGTVTGNGQTNQFTDSAPDTNRFYRVGAH